MIAASQRSGFRVKRISSLLAIASVFAVVLWPGWTGKAQGVNSAPTAGTKNYLTPAAARFSPDGAKLYVVCEDEDSVLAVDPRTQRVMGKVKVGHRPRGLAVSPDGKNLYVANEWSDTVSVVDAATMQVGRSLPTGWGPVGLATDKPGKTLYVANSIGNDISVLDLVTGTELKRLVSLRSPHDVELSRDGRRVYVANLLPHLVSPDESPISDLVIIDTQKQEVSERIEIPGVLELRHVAEAPAAQGGYLLVPFMRPKNLNPLIQVANGWILTQAWRLFGWRKRAVRRCTLK